MALFMHRGLVDTTAGLLANALDLLRRYPDQRAWLREHPDGWRAAIEEILRFESPIQVTDGRRTLRDVRVGDVIIPSGESVALIYGSGNRDERQFEDPDGFDVRRQPTRHLAFGEGIHFCLGAPLARLEALRSEFVRGA
jgi:cytochrome P450